MFRIAPRWTAVLCTTLVVLTGQAIAQVPDHPIITEVFNNPDGHDGPNGRRPANLHQEFIELYLPTAAQLDPALNKDNLRLTFYEIEGDSGNPMRGHVNQRIDLKPFDLDPSNGITPGAIARPSSGVVIIGWVDYDYTNQPPTALRGTPSTRVGLINGGITTSPPGTVFIAVNGAQFGGTTNFPVPEAESFVDVPNEDVTGIFRNGSNVYLLVNRDSPGYVSLSDNAHPEQGPSDANLPSGTVLQLSCLLDGIAGNDDTHFHVEQQPYHAPTGFNIDLEDILPWGGAFSDWVAQIATAKGGGYLRRMVDVRRTTEDGVPGNENPALDAETMYRVVFQAGPFFPTPGVVVFTTSPPQLSVALSTRQVFQVLANTTGRPGLISANVGGNYPINITAVPGASNNPAVATFATGPAAANVLGQTEAFPQIAVTVPGSAADGAVASAPVTLTATNVNGGDPAVINPVQSSVAQVTVLKPTQGIDVFGAPLEATVFAAVLGFGADPLVRNEFVGSSLGVFAAAQRGRLVRDARQNLGLLLDPNTDLESYATIGPRILLFPQTEADYINVASPAGTADLVTKVLNSAKVASGSTAYNASFNANRTALKAIQLPIPETYTKNGQYAASEHLFFADPVGNLGELDSGLSNVTTSRTFELAIIDTNVTPNGIESGDDDDFGLLVEVGQTRPGAAVLPGQFLFLSFSGGLEGEDIDTLDVPGVNATNAILLDLANLDDVLGCKTIRRLFFVDADVGGTLDPVEVLSLAAAYPVGDLNCDGVVNFADIDPFVLALSDPASYQAAYPNCNILNGDCNDDGNVDFGDIDPFVAILSGG